MIADAAHSAEAVTLSLADLGHVTGFTNVSVTHVPAGSVALTLSSPGVMAVVADPASSASALSLSFADAGKISGFTNVTVTDVKPADAAAALATPGVVSVIADAAHSAEVATLSLSDLGHVSGFTNVTVTGVKPADAAAALATPGVVSVIADSAHSGEAISLSIAELDHVMGFTNVTVINVPANAVAHALANPGVVAVVAEPASAGDALSLSFAELTKVSGFTGITMLDTAGVINAQLPELLDNANIKTISTNDHESISLTYNQATSSNYMSKFLESDSIQVMAVEGNWYSTGFASVYNNSKVDIVKIQTDDGSPGHATLEDSAYLLMTDSSKLQSSDEWTLLVKSAKLMANLEKILTDDKIDVISSYGSTPILNAALASSAGASKFDTFTYFDVTDTSVAINAHMGVLMADDNVHFINSTDSGVVNITAADLTGQNTGKLGWLTNVTLNVKAGDVINGTLSYSYIKSLNTGSAVVTGQAPSANVDNNLGGHNWFFEANAGGNANADQLTYWDQATSHAVTITLTGVAGVALTGPGVFNLTLDGM